MVRLFLLSLLLTLFSQAQTFKVSYDPDYAPFSYAINHKAHGLFIDIWKLWGKKNHYTVEFVEAKDWDDALSLAKSGHVDFFLGTEPYEPWMHASTPYYKTKTALFGLKEFNETIQSVGIIGEDYQEDIQNKLPQAILHSYETYSNLLNALLNHRIDVIYDDTLPISYFAIKNGYQHRIKKASSLSSISAVSAISSSPQAIERFNQGLKTLDTHQLEEVEKNWILDKDQRYYTTAQQCKNQVIHYVFDPDWRPFEYKDEMSHAHFGIIADILSLISSKSGITFKVLPTESWAASVKMVKEGKAQMFSAVPQTKEREQYLNFTKNSIYSYPAVLVSDENKPLSLSEGFIDKSIGIVAGNSLGEWLRDTYLYAQFREFKNIQEGLEALQRGEIEYFGINGITAIYYINVLGFDDLKIYMKTDYMFHLKIALRKEVDPRVIESIDTILASLSTKELSDIYHKWTSIQVKKELDWHLLGWILLALLFIVTTSILINKKLKQLIDKKTYQLKELNENLELKVTQRTQELTATTQKLQDSIEYASLIQNTILPDPKSLSACFESYFTLWQPKDVVGGDIYFFDTIDDTRHLLCVIDCTGHGVSGAFVTMLIKAIHEQMILTLTPQSLSPALLLTHFNQAFKQLLKQEQSNANVGFDAGIILIDTAKNQLTFAGANIPLFYRDNEQIKILKPNRYSVGYKQCDSHYPYQEQSISLHEGMQFYLSTDGYIDQNGGERGFPFGKRRFKRLLASLQHLPLEQHKQHLITALQSYQAQEERNDDITLIGFSPRVTRD